MKAVSRLSYRSFYIIDHYKRCFLYVSSGSLFLAGYNVEEVRNMGYDFYVRTLQPAELARISVINRLGFKFLHLLSEEERTEYTLAYHFRMFSKDGESIQVSHQLTPPLCLAADGRIWLSLCAVSLPTVMGDYDAYITRRGAPYRYALGEDGQWCSIPEVSLRNTEKAIIRFASQGYSTRDMARLMCKSVDTIKKYRKSLFEKLGTDKISEVITYATLHKLL